MTNTDYTIEQNEHSEHVIRRADGEQVFTLHESDGKFANELLENLNTGVLEEVAA